jgi:predicted nucleotidyltransferase
MALPPREKLAVEELCASLRTRFAARLRELALFGSRARGDAREDSDVDVLVVVDALTTSEAREVAHACGDLLTRHDVIVSPFVIATDRMHELRMRERRIAREIDQDAVRL